MPMDSTNAIERREIMPVINRVLPKLIPIRTDAMVISADAMVSRASEPFMPGSTIFSNEGNLSSENSGSSDSGNTTNAASNHLGKEMSGDDVSETASELIIDEPSYPTADIDDDDARSLPSVENASNNDLPHTTSFHHIRNQNSIQSSTSSSNTTEENAVMDESCEQQSASVSQHHDQLNMMAVVPFVMTQNIAGEVESDENDEIDYGDVKGLRRMYLKSHQFHVAFLSADNTKDVEEVANEDCQDYEYYNLCGRLLLPGQRKHLCGVRWKESAIKPGKFNTADGLISEDEIFEKYGTITYVGKAGQHLVLPGFMNRGDYDFPTTNPAINLHIGYCRACGEGPLQRKSVAEHFQSQHPHNLPQLPCRCPEQVVALRSNAHHRECLFCVCEMVFEDVRAKIEHLKRCFICHCGFKAKSRTALGRHVREDCLQCGICLKTYKQKGYLQKHLEKCFSCIDPKCRYKCKTLAELTEHRQVCLFEPYVEKDLPTPQVQGIIRPSALEAAVRATAGRRKTRNPVTNKGPSRKRRCGKTQAEALTTPSGMEVAVRKTPCRPKKVNSKKLKGNRKRRGAAGRPQHK